MTFIGNRKNSMCQILILILVTTASQGTPICGNIGQILADPCGGCHPVGAAGAGCQPSHDHEDALSNIITKARTAKHLCQTLKTKYNSEPKIRISDGYMAFLAGQNLYEYQFPNTQQNITMEEYYGNISAITIFVDVAYQQESSEDYKGDMKAVRNTLKHLLCSIHIATCSNSTNTLTNMTLDEYPFIVQSTAQRYERDFIVFRDAIDYLNSTTITTT